MSFSLLVVSFTFLLRAVILSYSGDTAGYDEVIIDCLQSAFASLIVFGGLAGRVSLVQLLMLILLFTLLFALFDALTTEYFAVADTGGSVTTHLKAACFSMGAEIALHLLNARSEYTEAPQRAVKRSSYGNRAISFVGTLVMFALFPLYNALGVADTGHTHFILPTFAALFGSAVIVFGLSGIVNRGRLEPAYVANLTLSGAVAAAAAVNTISYSYQFALLGIIAGALAVASSHFLLPYLNRRFSIEDTRHVLSVHGIPGFVGGIASAIAEAADGNSEAAKDMVGLTFLYAATPFLAGFITGSALARFNRVPLGDYYSDAGEWLLPPDVSKATLPVASLSAGSAPSSAASDIARAEITVSSSTSPTE